MLSGWDANKKIAITIPAQAETLTDFPVLVNLTAASGSNNFDCSAVFSEVSPVTTDDPHWSSTVLAMPMDGANNSTAFTDLKGKTVTRYGDAKISTVQSKFGGSSAYFDGNNDYLTVPISSDFYFAGVDFTIECWAYFSSLDSSGSWDAIFSAWSDSPSSGLRILAQKGGESGTGRVHLAVYGYGLSSFANSIQESTWYHLAFVVKDSIAAIYINGTLAVTPTPFAVTNPSGISYAWVGTTNGSVWWLHGYIDDLRITKGVARYTENFTPPNVSFHHTGLVTPKKIALEYGDTGTECFAEIERWDAVNKSAQVWVKVPSVSSSTETVLNLYYDSTHADNTPEGEPHWSSTVLAMPMDGANNSTAFTDLKGKTVTRYGDAKISTVQSKFGGSSAYFDGSGDYLSCASSSDFAFPGDFTVEFWVFVVAWTENTVLVQVNAATYGLQIGREGVTTKLGIAASHVAWYAQSSALPSTGAWHHIAAVRSGTTLSLYINGEVAATVPNTTSFAQGSLLIGGFTSNYYLNGYIDDLRITKGVARYTANFTPHDRSVFVGTVGDIGSHHGKRVWDNNYAAVYHLSQNPATTVLDSSTNARNLTPYGSMTTGQFVDGPTGKALAFDGNDDYMGSATSNLSALQTAYTLETVGKFSLADAWSEFIGINAVTGSPSVRRYDTTSYLDAGVYGDNLQSSAAINDTEFKTYGARLLTGSVQTFGNGTIASETNAVTIASLSTAAIYLANSVDKNANTIRSIRISSVARSASWLNASYLSDFDLLVSYRLEILSLLRVSISQPYDLVPWIIKNDIAQIYHLTFRFRTFFDQFYGLKLTALVSQFYGDTPKILQHLIQHYGDAAAVKRALVQIYGDALALRSILAQPYTLPAHLAAFIEQRYGLSGAELTQVVDQLWALKGVDEVKRVLDQPFGILADPGQLLSYSATVTTGGLTIDPLHISIEASQDQYCLSCEIHCGSQTDYLACVVGADLQIVINEETFAFFIESRNRNRGHGTAEYIVHGLSRTALLDAPYADVVSGPLTGMASAIVAGLAPGFTINWQTVDWFIPENTLMPADQTPLAIIRTIAHAAGAIVQTEKDGSLTIEPRYRVAVNQWEAVPVEYHLADSLDFFSTSETFEHRLGHNKFLVSDQLTSQSTLRLEEETLTDTAKYIRGYKTPWLDDFTLRHSGGDWVTIEPLATEAAEKSEVIEFVAGDGRTRYPIYNIVDLVWLQTPLGTVAHSEDGRLVADVAGESLLAITYRTRCKMWRVVNPRNEQVQFIIDGAEL